MVSVAAETPVAGSDRPAMPRAERIGRTVVLVIWLVLFAAMVTDHVVWRDEMRALSLVLSADGPIGLFQAVRPEGHPMLWYLLLGGVHALVADPVALKILGGGIAAAAMTLFILRAPLPPLLITLYAFAFPIVFDLGVVARNYGISALLMMILAGLMAEPRRNAPWIAVSLLLLANTNVHSAVLAMAFAGVFLVRLLPDRPGRADFQALLKDPLAYAVPATAALGVLACFLTVYPPTQDYFGSNIDWTAAHLLLAVVNPGERFPIVSNGLLPAVFQSLILFAAVAGLWRTPLLALLLFGVFAAFAVMFTALYTGYYRHQGLAIVAAVAIYWIARERDPRRPAIAGLGVLLACTCLFNAFLFSPLFERPFSMARTLCDRLQSRDDLKDAVVLSEPQWMVETLPYYCDNPTFLTREGRFGTTSYFARNRLQAELSMRELVDIAERLRRETGRKVVVMLPPDLDMNRPERPYPYWERGGVPLITFTMDARSVETFRARTTLLLEPERAFLSDERYQVHVFD